MQNKEDIKKAQDIIDAPCANDIEKDLEVFEWDYDKEYQNNGKKLITMINGVVVEETPYQDASPYPSKAIYMDKLNVEKIRIDENEIIEEILCHIKERR